MKSEFDEETKDLIRKLNNYSESYSKLYQQLKWILLYQILVMLALLIFIVIAIIVSDDIRQKISFMIIPLIILNNILVILRKNTQKRRMRIIYEEGTKCMGRLSDIIDWSSLRNKYINKEDKKVVNSITEFIMIIEKPLSPFRRFHAYYRLISLLGLEILVITIIYYILYCMSLMGLCGLSIIRAFLMN